MRATEEDRQEAIRREENRHEAIRRVQALTPVADTPPELAFDFDAWADRWHLHALRDLAPYLRRHWQNRPAAGARFESIPRVVRERRITLRITAKLDPDRETKDSFLAPIIAQAEAFYDKHAKALPVAPHHRRRQLQQHAEWYVRKHVQGWTFNRIADDVVTGTDTIRKGIATFARLLDRK